ncbi:rCG30573, isoform CRA_b [Rattus norvegicus]|uniref:RCG30573, isoform CRA_b n=1 Tax=Rattus norvegicus TaxID=10116 RepID=A6IUN9_RAT|nr:rCG30573, isoform CRA_b [Rattus norvegicus]
MPGSHATPWVYASTTRVHKTKVLCRFCPGTLTVIDFSLKHFYGGRRVHYKTAKSTCCCRRGPGFYSERTHTAAHGRLSTPVPWDLTRTLC